MSLLRYSTSRFGLTHLLGCCCRVVILLQSLSSPCCIMLHLLVVLGCTLPCHRVGFVIDLPRLIDPLCPPSSVGFDSLSLVSIHCHWFRVAAVGLLVVSPLSLLASRLSSACSSHTSSSSPLLVSDPTHRRRGLHVVVVCYVSSLGLTRCHRVIRIVVGCYVSSSDLHIILSGNFKRERRCPSPSPPTCHGCVQIAALVVLLSYISGGACSERKEDEDEMVVRFVTHWVGFLPSSSSSPPSSSLLCHSSDSPVIASTFVVAVMFPFSSSSWGRENEPRPALGLVVHNSPLGTATSWLPLIFLPPRIDMTTMKRRTVRREDGGRDEEAQG